ncbi:MAG: L,D-transpeptidase family protein, partial [Candidatus Competibacteraceae bacterium]|nr:L,D-transpeptidase family protein [Candidatus Competibacteraceae bacterium]
MSRIHPILFWWLLLLLGVGPVLADPALQLTALAEVDSPQGGASPGPGTEGPAVSDPLDRAVALQLRQVLNGVDPPRAAGRRLDSSESLARFYATRSYRPGWLESSKPAGKHPGPQAAALLEMLNEADSEGLGREDYHYQALVETLSALEATPGDVTRLAELELLLSDAFLSYGKHLLQGRSRQDIGEGPHALVPRQQDLAVTLEAALSGGDVALTLAGLRPPYPQYQRLRGALAQYRQLAAAGNWPLVPGGDRLEEGVTDPRVGALRARLRASGELAAGTLPVAGEDYFDRDLAGAVRAFQSRHGLAVDGVVGPNTLTALNVSPAQRVRQIELNLERWRWMPEDLGQRHILVNVPAFELTVYEQDRPVLSMPVVVGRFQRQTPLFTARMSYLVMSPYWHIPRTIAIEDKLPVLRRNPHALYRQGIRIYDARSGRSVDPGAVDWSSVSGPSFYRNYRLRQNPGSNNALGRIKFMFPNPWNVYLHDTPQDYLFSRAHRAYSSGCVRVARPYDLAE